MPKSNQHSGGDPNAGAREVAAACACAGLRKASRAVTQRFDAALAPTGLRATQFNLLSAIALCDGISLGRLAHALVMDRTTLTRNLRPLQNKGLVRSEPGQDRRERRVRLTRRGRAAFEHALPRWREAQRDVMDRFGDHRWRALQRELGGMVEAAHADT